MKNISITIILITLIVVGFMKQSRAQVANNNFENGNWLFYSNLCWGIGPNNAQFYTTVTGNGFNGTKVCETADLGQRSPCVLLSPWIQMNGNDQITFNHALTAYSGTRTLKVYLVSFPSLTEELVFTYNYTDGNQHTGTISHTKSGNYKVKWVWTGSGGNSRGQLDNIVIGGTYNSDPSNGCQPIPDPIVDTDGDGVPDGLDGYPADPYRAYDNTYPASDTSTVAFEDLWPSYGDYDMNDLVVGYKFRVVSNAQHQVVELFGTFVLRASGAANRAGFGFTLPGVNANSIISTAGYDVLPSSFYDLAANGTENGQILATVIVFDDAKRFIPHENTTPGVQTDPYRRFHVYLQFMSNGTPGQGGAVNVGTLNISGFNPFLITGNGRGKEVHLPGYPPTSKADLSLFGTYDDDSNAATGKYYQSKTNLVWAMDICTIFDYPVEKTPINQGHLYFLNWAESNGKQNPDWYLNKPGNRDPNKLYHR